MRNTPVVLKSVPKPATCGLKNRELTPLSTTISLSGKGTFHRLSVAGFESRTDLSPDDRIERTVFIKAPETFHYGDVVKIIDAVKGAGANPVGLQTEALEQ